MNAHRARVVTLSEQLRRIAPDRYGDVDPQLLRDYASQHDLAKVEDGSRFKGYLSDSFGKNVGKSPLIDELNVRDGAIEDAFMTKNDVSPEMRAKLSEIVKLADITDRGWIRSRNSRSSAARRSRRASSRRIPSERS